jgi:membrane protein required for colicin V production
MDATQIIDIAMMGLVGIAAIVGLVKGLVRQVVELAGIIASFILAMIFAGWLAETLRLHTPLPYSPSMVVAFVVLLVLGIVASHLIALSVQKLVRMTFLGWFDRVCGGALGLVVGLIIASLLVSVAMELPISGQARGYIDDSRVCMFVRPIAPRIFNAVFSWGPDEIDFDSFFKNGGPI